MGKQVVEFQVNVRSPIAVYVQIENQVQFAIAAGHLAPGDTLPSVRDMSAMLDINPNTVTKAYRDLELMGLVVTRRGVGVAVAPDAEERCSGRAHELVTEHLNDAVGEAVACGWSSTRVHDVVEAALRAGARPYAASAKGNGHP